MSETGAHWEADRMLDIYIYDYLKKRKLHASAEAFQAEGKVSTEPVAIDATGGFLSAIDAPCGFLFEWWSVFWDVFIASTNDKHSEAATSYLKTQFPKDHLQQQPVPKPNQNQQSQVQQLLLQRAQQQQRGGNHPARSLGVGGLTADFARENPAAASAFATKLYEDSLKSPLQREPADDLAMKQRLGGNILVHPNQISLLKGAALGGQSSGQILQGISRGSPNGWPAQTQNREPLQQLVSIQDAKSGVGGPLIGGFQGTNLDVNNLTLKGWPLTGFDQLGLLKHQRVTPSSQSLNKLQLPQHILLQAQQHLASPSMSEGEQRNPKLLFGSCTVSLGKDSTLNSTEMLGHVRQPMQVGSPIMHGDIDMLIKQQVLNNRYERWYAQYPLSGQQSQSSSQNQQDNLNATGNNQKTSKSQTGRKRKQSMSSSGPDNSAGTANTTGPSPSSPQTPSTHTPRDTMVISTMSRGTSKPLLTFGSDGLGSHAAATNEVADVDGFINDGALDENIDSLFSHDAADARAEVTQSSTGTGVAFSKIRVIDASTGKVECCHFSHDGKLLATGGHNKKVTLWCTESFKVKSTLEEHSQYVTDVRFSPHMRRLATSSTDKSVKVWDADNPGHSLRTFTGHSTTVTMVDFHPTKQELICSCDSNREIRYWTLKNGSCMGVFKGGATMMRFQPRGRIVAAVIENVVSILDLEAHVCKFKLQGHQTPIRSVCWNFTGELLASVSDDLVRVWTVSGGKWECVHELIGADEKFHTCVFHPAYSSLLVIGCYETLELWNIAENKRMTVQAHKDLVSALAASNVSGLVASASHDGIVKLWK